MADKQFILNKAAEYARQYGIDPRIFVSQIFKESTFNPDATGKLGEKGLTQVLKKTALKPGYKVKPMDWSKGYDIDENLRFGAEYLAAMLKNFDGDYYKALQAYNGGVGNVNKGTVSGAAKKYADDIISKAVPKDFLPKPEVTRYPTEFTTPTNERTSAEMLMSGAGMDEDSLLQIASVLKDEKDKKRQSYFEGARNIMNALGSGLGSLFGR
jgi:membrane-bound lytic murein transglycosylase MltF